MEEKIKVVVSGCNGRMGKIVLDEIKSREDMIVVSGLSRKESFINNLKVYTYEKFNLEHDIIIDFSHKDNLDNILRIAEEYNSKLVICTTGYSKNQLEKIEKFSINHAVFLSSNTSVGVNLLLKISKIAKEVLGKNFDIEIIEKHHNRKVDAPSGTALTIAKELSNEDTKLIFDRSKECHVRSKNEIGIHSVRGGNIKGEHEVLFISDDEILTIKHSAYSRSIFAKGALDAAKFIVDKKQGLYKNII